MASGGIHGQRSAFRKKYEDAGVKIQIVKVDAIDTFTDEEIDYMFGLAKTAGATRSPARFRSSHTKRLGEFGEKHKMMIGYHGHTNITSPEAFGGPESWETAMSYSKYNGINLDIGHFIAGQQHVADSVPAEVSRPRHPHSPQGPQDAQRPQHAVGRRRHAHQRNAETDAEGEVWLSPASSRWSTRFRRART